MQKISFILIGVWFPWHCMLPGAQITDRLGLFVHSSHICDNEEVLKSIVHVHGHLLICWFTISHSSVVGVTPVSQAHASPTLHLSGTV